MAYDNVDIDAALKPVVDRVQAARDDGTYDGHEADWDKQVYDALVPVIQKSVKQNNDGNRFIRTTHDSAKSVIDQAEALVKKKGKKITGADVQTLTAAAARIAGFTAAMTNDSRNLMAAIGDLRKTWPDTARAALSNPAVIKPLLDARQDSIDETRNLESVKKRVGEYETRIKSMLAVARKLSGQAVADNAGALADFEREVKKALDLAKKPLALGGHSPYLVEILKLNPKRALSPAELKDHQSTLSAAQAQTKDWRGGLKTAERLYADFKKASSGLTGNEKKAREAALANAYTEWKKAAAALKIIDKEEAKAVKIMKDVAKR